MTERLYWYIVVWSNKTFPKAKQKLMEVGDIFGTTKKADDNRRVLINKKTKDFEIVEKYSLICRASKDEFREIMGKVKI